MMLQWLHKHQEFLFSEFKKYQWSQVFKQALDKAGNKLPNNMLSVVKIDQN